MSVIIKPLLVNFVNKSLLSLSFCFLVLNHAFAGEITLNNKEVNLDKKWDASIEFGYVSISGNNETTSTNARLNLGYEVDKWKHAAYFSTQGNKNDASPNSDTESYNAQVKSDYKISKKGYAFAVLDYDQIDNSGFDYQTSAGFGLGYNFIKNKKHAFDGELGYGSRRNKTSAISVIDSPPDGIPSIKSSEDIVRIAGNYKWILSESATFKQRFTREIGSNSNIGSEDNTISTFSASLTSNLVRNLSMKVSREARWQSVVPVDISKRDTVTSFTVVYSFQ